MTEPPTQSSLIQTSDKNRNSGAAVSRKAFSDLSGGKDGTPRIESIKKFIKQDSIPRITITARVFQ